MLVEGRLRGWHSHLTLLMWMQHSESENCKFIILSFYLYCRAVYSSQLRHTYTFSFVRTSVLSDTVRLTNMFKVLVFTYVSTKMGCESFSLNDRFNAYTMYIFTYEKFIIHNVTFRLNIDNRFSIFIILV